MSTQPPAFKLTAAERTSTTWQRLHEHLTQRLDKLRAANDKPQTEAETAALRGQILEVKRLMRLDDDAPEITPAS